MARDRAGESRALEHALDVMRRDAGVLAATSAISGERHQQLLAGPRARARLADAVDPHHARIRGPAP